MRLSLFRSNLKVHKVVKVKAFLSDIGKGIALLLPENFKGFKKIFGVNFNIEIKNNKKGSCFSLIFNLYFIDKKKLNAKILRPRKIKQPKKCL
jgi:hypothetical protein